MRVVRLQAGDLSQRLGLFLRIAQDLIGAGKPLPALEVVGLLFQPRGQTRHHLADHRLLLFAHAFDAAAREGRSGLLRGLRDVFGQLPAQVLRQTLGRAQHAPAPGGVRRRLAQQGDELLQPFVSPSLFNQRHGQEEAGARVAGLQLYGAVQGGARFGGEPAAVRQDQRLAEGGVVVRVVRVERQGAPHGAGGAARLAQLQVDLGECELPLGVLGILLKALFELPHRLDHRGLRLLLLGGGLPLGFARGIGDAGRVGAAEGEVEPQRRRRQREPQQRRQDGVSSSSFRMRREISVRAASAAVPSISPRLRSRSTSLNWAR